MLTLLFPVNPLSFAIPCALELRNLSVYTADARVLRGSVVKCLTRNPWVLGLKRTPGTSGETLQKPLRKTLQIPGLILVKPKKDIENASCRRDMTEILLKTV